MSVEVEAPASSRRIPGVPIRGRCLSSSSARARARSATRCRRSTCPTRSRFPSRSSARRSRARRRSPRWTSRGTSRGCRSVNFSIDQGLYPLGSCTMKHNPRTNEEMARLPGLRGGAPARARGPVAGHARAGVAPRARPRRADGPAARHAPAVGRRAGRARRASFIVRKALEKTRAAAQDRAHPRLRPRHEPGVGALRRATTVKELKSNAARHDSTSTFSRRR